MQSLIASIPQELSRIKKSTSTTWGLLPPRQGEPDHDEQLLWELSNKRSRMDRPRGERTRHRSLATSSRRPLEPHSFNTESDLSFESGRHYSDPGPFSPLPGDVHMGTGGGEAKRPQRLRKKSVKQWDEETRKTEETLKKFNEVFPSDGKVGVMQLRPVGGGESAGDEVDGATGGGVPPRKASRVEGKPDPGDSSTKYSSKIRRESMANGGQQPNNPTVGPENFVKRMSTTTITIIREDSSLSKKQRNSLSLGASPNTQRRESTSRAPPLAARRLSNSGSTSVPKALELLKNEDKDANSENKSPKKSSSIQVYPITVVDVQEARDNIVRRLVGNSISGNTPKRRLDSPKGLRALSPIREQKTELNLTSASMPQFPTTSFSDPSPAKPKQKGKKKGVEEDEEGPKFDSYRYNPDGTIRTMHLLPDFSSSLEEAMKARYIRHTEKQWFERELNVTEIFQND